MCSWKKVLRSSNFEFSESFYISIQRHSINIKSLVQKWQKLFNFYFFILWEIYRDFWNLLLPTFTKWPITFDLHIIRGWHFHKMFVTKFGLMKKSIDLWPASFFTYLRMFDRGCQFTSPPEWGCKNFSNYCRYSILRIRIILNT